MQSLALNPEQLRSQLIWANEREVERDFLQHQVGVARESPAWFIRTGSLSWQAEHDTLTGNPGDWVFPGQDPGEVQFSPGSRIISIRFLLLHADGRLLFPGQSIHRCSGQDFPGLEQSALRLLTVLAPWQQQGTLMLGRHRIPLPENLEIESAFQGFLAQYCRFQLEQGEHPQPAGQEDQRVQQALQELTLRDMRLPFSEAELGKQVGLGPRQLRRLFEQETGQSPFQHYDHRRQELARHSLRESRAPLKELAYDLGFSSPAHFSNWFRNRCGVSPGQYRKRGLAPKRREPPYPPEA